jgi:predicted helicase
MESRRVRTNKASGIVNDPNDWATERDDLRTSLTVADSVLEC